MRNMSDEQYFAASVARGALEGGPQGICSMVGMMSGLDLPASAQENLQREEFMGRVRRGMIDELKEMRELGRMMPDELDSVVLAGLMVGQKINDQARAE